MPLLTFVVSDQGDACLTDIQISKENTLLHVVSIVKIIKLWSSVSTIKYIHQQTKIYWVILWLKCTPLTCPLSEQLTQNSL